MRFPRFICALVVLSFVSAGTETRAAVEDVWRLYDLTPVSTNNPVLAQVAECGIEIPLSEFAAFVRSDTPPDDVGKQLTLTDKKRELQKLLDNYFWIWEGYANKADQTHDIAGLLNITKTEAMKALLLQREADSKAHSLEEYEKLKKEFEQRVFDKAEIHISPKAYEILKTGAQRINEADRAKTNSTSTNGALTTVDGLSDAESNLILATCKVGSVSVGNLLRAYRQIPVASRPDFQKQAGLIQVLQQMWTEPLLLAEAQARGLDRAEPVRTQVQSDRTGLVREWALDQVTQKAVAEMKTPGIETRLRQWYQANLTNLYTSKDNRGKKHVMSFETDRATIESDYFNSLMEKLRVEELQKLRQGKKIVINEALLEKTPVFWFIPPVKNELRTSDVNWNGDTREYVVKPGETNTSFAFCLTNISTGELVIEDIHPVNEFVTVQSPSLPWTLHPGDRGELHVNVDLRNKFGTGYAPIEVLSSMGDKTLTLKITYPPKQTGVSRD